MGEDVVVENEGEGGKLGETTIGGESDRLRFVSETKRSWLNPGTRLGASRPDAETESDVRRTGDIVENPGSVAGGGPATRIAAVWERCELVGNIVSGHTRGMCLTERNRN